MVTPTMKDQSIVNVYANTVIQDVYNQWGDLTANERATKIHSAVSAAHFKCRVPTTGLTILTSSINYGTFDFATWKLEIHKKLFDTTTLDKNTFIKLAGTFYHEGRHCEQWWHVARLVAMTQKSFINLARSLGISRIAAGLAVSKKMSPDYDPMRLSAEAWYKSIYGSQGNQRGVVLSVLSLKQNGPDQLMHGFRNGSHQNYSGNLPEEKDAFAVEKLVTDRLIKKIPSPRPRNKWEVI